MEEAVETARAESLGERVIKLGNEIALLEEKLLSPDRTVDDLIRHMQLIRQLRGM